MRPGVSREVGPVTGFGGVGSDLDGGDGAKGRGVVWGVCSDADFLRVTGEAGNVGVAFVGASALDLCYESWFSRAARDCCGSRFME